jgi:N6-adenosine-specific RNA methylase IME4
VSRRSIADRAASGEHAPEFDLGPGLRLEAKIAKSEGEGIRARWEFGRWLLAQRVGKQLPNGLLDQLVEVTGTSRQELGYRMRFAERYATADELANAVGNFGSWHAMVNTGLRGARPDPVETPPLPGGVFRCIVADPPWQLDTGPGWEYGDSGHKPLAYPQMTLDAIEALDVKDHSADDAHLYLWTPNRYLRDAYDVAEAWGFKPSVVLAWAKAPRGVGLGDTYRLTMEFILFARRGSLPHRKIVERSWFDWPRGKHSQKPAAFYEMVESVTPGPHLEMFARGERYGWTVWGDEVTQREAVEPEGDPEDVARAEAAIERWSS